MDLYNDNLHKNANPKLYEYGRALRQETTEAEEFLWERIRNKKLDGLKFRRQHPLLNYIADFYCHEKKLVIELDGTVHTRQENKEYDRGRTFELQELGVTVIRFWNDEVLNDTESVLAKIKEVAGNR
ncbi:MAG TPA: endonuclease domain-containing protein [Segetibacter sp.]|jgi:very-short-patch-repair endonuclease